MRVRIIVIGLLVFASCSSRGTTSSRDETGLPSPQTTTYSIVEAEDAGSRILLKGDWGDGGQGQKDISSAMCQVSSEIEIDLIFTTGDNFYPFGRATKENFDDPEACLRKFIWKPAWGNHDRGNDTSDVLGAPGRYYQFEVEGVVFLVLDSNFPGNRDQSNWLKDALAESSGKPVIAVFHHPPFSIGKTHGSNLNVRALWVPQFEKSGVKLVLAGHNHLYEHSVVNGIHYVVSGGGGSVLYECGERQEWSIRCQSIQHFLLIELDRDSARIIALNKAGGVVDEFDVPMS